MAAKRAWYGKSESTPARHARERGETFQRHTEARADLNKQQESELSDLTDRQAAEARQQAQEPQPGEQQSSDEPPANMSSPHEVLEGVGARGGRAYGPGVAP
jgi:hypothetical protein